MIKQLLAVASVALVTACSSGGNSDSGTPPVNPPDNNNNNPPASGTRVGAYIGDFGAGNGVYVIDNGNNLAGIAVGADGAANSLYGNIGSGSTYNGTLRNVYHDASTPATQGVYGPGVPGIDAAGTPGDKTFNLNIVDGQSIESLSGPSVALRGVSAGELTTADTASLAGTWTGQHRYCGANETNCSVLHTEVSFSGTAISGRTYVVESDGTQDYEFPVQGTLTPLGEVSLVSFTWLDNTYTGAALFIPGSSSELAFFGETQADVNRKTIASLLTR